MARCAREGCGHRRRRHRAGPCEVRPKGHCPGYVAREVPPPQPQAPPEPDEVITPNSVDPTLPDTRPLQAWLDAFGPGKAILISDPEFVYKLARPLIPDMGQTLILEADLSGDQETLVGIALKSKNVRGVSIMGSPVRRGVIRDFVDQGVELWIGSFVSNIEVRDVLGTGMGSGFEGIPENDCVVEFVEVHRCGSLATLGHDAGGIKFARTGHINGPIVRNSKIHDCFGNGVWADVQSCNYDVIDNEIWAVGRKGVHYEKSGGSDEQGPPREGRAYIARNKIWDTGLEGREHSDGGIVCVSSMNMLIEDNETHGSRGGFVARQDGRVGPMHPEGYEHTKDEEKHGWRIENVVARRNDFQDGVIGNDLPGVSIE